MCAPRHAALLALLLLSLSSCVSSGGVLEIADLTYELDQRVLERMRRDPAYSIKVKICPMKFKLCKTLFESDIMAGQSLGPILLEQPKDNSWVESNLLIEVYNPVMNRAVDYSNTRYVDFVGIEASIFLEHDWQLQYSRSGLMAIRFRHRVVCQEGFTGLYCDERSNVVPKTPTPEISPVESTSSTVPSSSELEGSLTQNDMFKIELVVAPVLAAVLLLGLCSLVIFKLTRPKANVVIDFEKECTLSVVTSTSTLPSLENTEPSTLKTETISETE